VFKKLATVTAVVAAAVISPLALASTAGASAAPASVAVAGGDFCSLSVDTQRMVCVATAADLPAARGEAAAPAGADASARSSAARAVFIIGKLYDNSDLNDGRSHLEMTSGGQCTSSRTNIDFFSANLGAWSNRISSFQAFANCAIKIYDGVNYGGSAFPGSGYALQSLNVGAMNDAAESIRFS
jgi:hypothetical protein